MGFFIEGWDVFNKSHPTELFIDYLSNKVYENLTDEWDDSTEELLHITEIFGVEYKIAVQFVELHAQVCNGGFYQWLYNGYAERDLDDLLEICEESTNDVLLKLAKLLNSCS